MTMNLCACESGNKQQKLDCFKTHLRNFYKKIGTYDLTTKQQLDLVSSLGDFNFQNYWGLYGYDVNGEAFGGSVTLIKNTKETSRALISNIILHRFFFNLSKNHLSFQKLVTLPDSSINSKIFQDSL